MTGDCRVLTVKISIVNWIKLFWIQIISDLLFLERGGNKRLACIGDPYSSNGSRCLPIEGNYRFLKF